MTVAEAVRGFRKEFGLTQTEFGSILGLSQASISNLESGRETNITDDRLRFLRSFPNYDPNEDPDAEYMDVSELPPPFQQKWDALRWERMAMVLIEAIDDARAGAPQATPPESNVRARVESQVESDVMVPWYSISVRAGDGAPIFEEAVRQFNVSQHYRNTAVYEVSGDSMIKAGIEEGDRVVVRLTALFKNNDIILCRYNNTMMVKGATIGDGAIWLHPANDHMHSWKVADGDQFECVGVVEEVIRKPYKLKYKHGG